MRDETDRIRAALAFVQPTDRNTWLRMGMAVKAELGDGGFGIWDEWSQADDSYDARDARDVWRSIRPGGKVTGGTLFHAARECGWADDDERRVPTPEELAERRKVAAERAALDAAETASEQAETAERAAAVFKASTAAGADHPYLLRKQVAPTETLREIPASIAARLLGYAPKAGGEPLSGRLLVVPVKRGNRLSTLELIDGDGRKAALAGRGTKAGGFWATARLPDGNGDGLTLLLGEGVATALSAAEAAGLPAVAALSAANLPKVAATLRERYAEAALVLLADVVKASGQPDPHAVEAAKSIGGRLAVPDFGPQRIPEQTDFNDLAVRHGADAVRRAIEAAAAPAMGRADRGPLDSPEGATEGGAEPGSLEPGGKHPTCKYGGGRFEVTSAGVRFLEETEGGGAMWVCSTLHVRAMTRDATSSAWGRLLEWRDADGERHQWAMPAELLHGDGSEVRRELARQGLAISPGRKARDLLAAYLQVWPTDARARCVERLGWHGQAYVTPTEAIGAGAEAVVFQNAAATGPALSVSGTVEQWRDTVAALAAGNSRAVFVVSAALAGPLADTAGEDGGGFHLRGGSSTGKSTLLRVAASVWGDPATYPRVWRATVNGLEALAALHNDALLILDELSQIDPREAADAAYLLGNGQGKSRAGRTGAARQAARWRLLFLSAGEESLSALAAKAGRATNAGAEIRLADIPADAGAGLGAFETLHGQASPGALALALKDAADKYHGAAGLQWLRFIVADRVGLADEVADGIGRFVAEVAPTDAAGQVQRVARRFGLVAVAGELATRYGLTGWAQGEATVAVKTCFAAWLDAFGGAGNREERALLAQVRAFLGAHGASRFEDLKAEHEQRVPNRAGFYRFNAAGQKEFLVLQDTFLREVCAGFDTKQAIDTLRRAGWLLTGDGGRPTQKPRLPGMGLVRCYVLGPACWDADEPDRDESPGGEPCY